MIRTCDPNPWERKKKTLEDATMRYIEPRQELAMDTRMAWPKRDLTVAFLDGSPLQREMLVSVVQGTGCWSSVCGVEFTWIQGPDADIRISFAYEGCWSFIGSTSLGDAGKPSMNYGWLHETTPYAEWERVVVHEFGHALGFIHEHQSPAVEIPWNKPVVYEHYAKYGWSQSDVDANVFGGWDKATTNFSAYDSKSIMAYWIAKEFVLDPAYAHGVNDRMSENDKKYAAMWYGPPRWRRIYMPYVTKRVLGGTAEPKSAKSE